MKRYYKALSTYPDFRHFAQTLILLLEPLTTALTLLRFGLHDLRLVLFEKDTLFPNLFPFPHTSHTLAIKTPPRIKHNSYFHISDIIHDNIINGRIASKILICYRLSL